MRTTSRRPCILEKSGVEHVLWATLREERQSWARMNEMIVAAAKKHTEVTVLDWNGQARVHPDWLQPAASTSPCGAQGMATMINDSLVALGLATRAGTVAASSRSPRARSRGPASDGGTPLVSRRAAARLRAAGRV